MFRVVYLRLKVLTDFAVPFRSAPPNSKHLGRIPHLWHHATCNVNSSKQQSHWLHKAEEPSQELTIGQLSSLRFWSHLNVDIGVHTSPSHECSLYQSPCVSLRSIFILFSNLILGLQICLFTSGLPTTILRAFSCLPRMLHVLLTAFCLT